MSLTRDDLWERARLGREVVIYEDELPDLEKLVCKPEPCPHCGQPLGLFRDVPVTGERAAVRVVKRPPPPPLDYVI